LLLTTLIIPSSASAAAPFGLKGTFWETGEMVYRKEAVPAAEALLEFRNVVEQLRESKRLSEVGDMASVRTRLEDDVSERRLRLAAAPLLAAVEESGDLALAFDARQAFRDVVAAYANVETALAARDFRGSSGLVSQLVTGLTASGLIFLFPPAAVNSALRRTAPTDGDAGLALVGALDDCIRASDTFLALVARVVAPRASSSSDTAAGRK